MNVDRGKESFTQDEIQELRDRALELKSYESLSWDALGKRIGVPGGTLSQWAPGKYSGDNEAVASKVHKFFLADEARQEMELQAPIVPGFQYTRTAREIMAQCRWAQRGKLVVAVGTAGIGKTGGLRQYASLTPNVYMSTMSEGTSKPTAMLYEILLDMGADEMGAMSIQALTKEICRRLKGSRALLIVDEAQHLSDNSLEQLRHVYDRIGVGVLLAGNPEVLTRIGTRKAGFAQIHSRVSLPHHYRKPYDEDVAMMCDAWDVKHPREREFLAHIAALPGCLRNMTQALELATLAARGAGEDRTLDHIRAAWAQHSLRSEAA